ncbi:DNA alkylation repair protein [Kutzneria kofuensis]|uniref:3-methyladenine DNA glycosylase AlkC n=1 Tax=Kutzneria kofuensis TaxID=103725 RepID=A0A7W9KM97_9PSEU|nr:DNA alkylation repair protein [Kutzneria kofuensis]MBB5895171.1 3-methyladenine DNA glycosylase AlkC [Kutzneria kofuensis]
MPTAEEMLSVAAVRTLADVLGQAPTVRSVQLDGAAFSDRGRLVRDALLADLPAKYASFERAIRRAMQDPRFTGWMIWPVTEAVAVRAVPDAFDEGLALVADLTSRLTGEFALRTFLAADLDRTLAAALRWTASPDEHVRRLASEGTRPRLPWAKRVPAILDDPQSTVPILDALHRDPSPYVRRSVANHLNDISRADPALAVDIATRWLTTETLPLVRHALRTLIKAADPGALSLLGFPPATAVTVVGPTLGAAHVRIGEELPFEFTLRNDGGAEVRLAVDYVVHHRKANGTLSPKVFKLTTRTLAAGESVTIGRRHSFRPISTRVYHAGEHALELQVNGRTFGRTSFTLRPQG